MNVRPFASLLLLATLLWLPAPASADVVKVVVDDTIHPITDEYIGRALEEAKATKAEAVLIELRTPGGLVDSTRSIIEKLLASPVPVIIYIAPSGSRAASAGFFLLEAADVAAMAPGTNTGAAHPVLLGEKMDPLLKEKMENDSAAFMRSFVAKRGRNVEAAESGVRHSKSFTEQEALKLNLIDYVATSEQHLFEQLKGKPVRRFDGTTTTLDLVGKPVRPFEMTLKQRILAYIMDPNVAFMLFSIGMLALWGEFKTPGAIFPGVIGLICILLALFAFNILPTRFAAFALIVAAFVLFALEAKFASYGILGAGGVLCMVLGALMLVDAPIPEMRIKLWTALAVAVPFGVIAVFLMTLALRAQMAKVQVGTETMVGVVGVARTPLSPKGKVFVQGELWDAVSTSSVETGAEVRVRKVEGLVLDVEPFQPAAGREGPAAASS
ncbi:MAG: nodulation protein NfeD [Acidobacteria bacterium]|nr:nodulation protein NfeD [Acidobacteriota bacterium]